MAEAKPQRKAKRSKAKAKPKASTRATPTAKARATGAAKRRTAAKRKSSATATRASAATSKGRARGAAGARARTSEVPRDVLKSVEEGQRAAVEAVRKFIDTVDRALPLRGQSHTRRQEIVDSAMEMADKLVQTQFDLLRKAVRNAGKTFGDSRKRR
jgi:hypothetical protein